MSAFNLGKNEDFVAKALEKLSQVQGHDWQSYLDAIGQIESGGTYDIQNQQGYTGAYQVGDGVLKDHQFIERLGNDFNVHSLSQLQTNPVAQEAVNIMEFSGVNSPSSSRFTQVKSLFEKSQEEATSAQMNDKKTDDFPSIPPVDFNEILNKTVTVNYTDAQGNVIHSDTIKLTQAGISSAAHLIGPGNMGEVLSKVAVSVQNHNDSVTFGPNDKYVADGSGIPFSTYNKLTQDYDISPLIGASSQQDYFDLFHARLEHQTGAIQAEASKQGQTVGDYYHGMDGNFKSALAGLNNGIEGAPDNSNAQILSSQADGTPTNENGYSGDSGAKLPAEAQAGNNSIDYTIQSGDSLSAIAQNFGTSVKDLMEWNNISDPNKIAAGSSLTLKGNAAENAALDKQLDAGIAQENYNNQLADENAFIKESLASINAEEATVQNVDQPINNDDMVVQTTSYVSPTVYASTSISNSDKTLQGKASIDENGASVGIDATIGKVGVQAGVSIEGNDYGGRNSTISVGIDGGVVGAGVSNTRITDAEGKEIGEANAINADYGVFHGSLESTNVDTGSQKLSDTKENIGVGADIGKVNANADLTHGHKQVINSDGSQKNVDTTSVQAGLGFGNKNVSLDCDYTKTEQESASGDQSSNAEMNCFADVNGNQVELYSSHEAPTELSPITVTAKELTQDQIKSAALDKQLDADIAQEQYNNQLSDENAFIKDSLASINAEENTQLDAQLDAASQEEDYLNQLDEENDFIKESLDSINAEEKSNKTIMDASSTTSQGFKQWMSLTTHEDWNDEQWEQQLIGSAIDTTSFAIGESFTTDGMQWTKVNEAFDNNLEGAGTSLVASQIINEGLGLKFGSGLDGQIANAVTTQVVTKTVDAAYQAIQAGQTLSEFGSSVSTNIGNMFYNAEAASQVSQAGNLKELGNVSQIGNLVGGIVGSYAAQQVLNSGTEAEVIGSAIGSTVGTILGSTFLCFLGPLGAAIGSYLGAAIGDTLGEKFNEYSEMDVGEIALDLINPISAVNLVGNFVSAVFGMDEKPPEPEAGVTLEYNPYTGVYEIVSTYEKNGGKTEGIEGASHSLSSSIQDTLNQIAGSGQIANRYDLPKIEVGYIGKHQYIKVNGQDVGKIDSQGMKNTIGTVLKDTVIEGGDTYVNRMVHNDQVSASDILSLVSSAKHLEAYDNDAGLKDFVDQLLNEKQADLATYNDSTAELSAVQQQITQLEKQIEGDQSEQRTTKMQLAMGADDVFEDDLQDIEDTLAAHQQQLSALQAKQTELQSTIDSLFAKDINNPDVGLKQAIEWQTYFNNTQSLNLQNPDVLDDATRLKYEIIHHNQLNADNPDQQFSLFETDMSDLVFEQKDGELTIYNRRGENADTPLSDVPHITIPDWKNWSSTDSNIKLDFTNSDTNEAVEVKSDIHQLMVDVNRLDNSLSGETPDYNLTSENLADKNMTVNIAKTVADINNASGIDMTEQQALDNQFSGFGQQIDSKLSGLNGDDILLANDATAQVDAGSGDDLIVESVAVTDNIGGAGSDTASYILSDEGVSVDLTTGQGHGGYAEGDTFDSIENAVGSHYNDQLIGSDDDNTLSGLEGNDFLSGGAGNDILLGGEGDDVLDGGAGKDHIDGGSGTDTLTFSDQEADGVHVSLNQTSVNGGEADGFANDGKNSDSLGGLENVLGTDGNDRVVGNEANNTLVGKAGDDRLDGMEGDDILSGGEGDDILSGGSGNDTLYGDAGDDILIGGEGDDTLYAGEGSDTLIGGQGNDTAILQGSVEDYALLNTINGSVTLQGPDNEITRFDGIEQVAFQQEDGTAVVTDMDTLLERLAQIDKEAREEQEDGGGVRTGINAAASAAFATSMVAALSAQAQELSNSEQVSEQQNQLFEDNTLFQTESSGLENTTSTSQQIDQMNALLGTETVNTSYEPTSDSISQTGITGQQSTTSASDATSSTEVTTSDTLNVDNNGQTLNALNLEQSASLASEQVVVGNVSDTSTPQATTNNQGSTDTENTATTTNESPVNTGNAFNSTATFLAPLVTTQTAITLEDNSVALFINVTGQNPNDETLEVYISNVPVGAKLSAGTLLNDGRYLLQPKELSGLIFYPTENSGVDVNLNVSVLATSISTGFAQSSSANLPIHLEPVADAPTLEVATQSPVEDIVLGGVTNGSGTYAGTRGSDTIQTGDENDTIYGNGYVRYPLNIASVVTDLDGSESISSLRLTGLPTGTVILNSNNVPLNINNGQYLTDFDVRPYLPVSIAVPTNTGAFSFDVVSQSQENLNGKTAETAQNFTLNTHDQNIGNDTIHSGGGDDTIVSGDGSNRIYGEGGNDTIYTQGTDTVLDGGLGEDTLIFSGGKTLYDLSGMSNIEHIQLNDSVQEIKIRGELDESLFIGHEAGENHKFKITGSTVGAENVLRLDIGLQDFLTQLHSGSSAYQLIKNSSGNDELVYEGKYYELEDIARLQFSSGYQGTDTLYLDERNNQPFYVGGDSVLNMGVDWEDGSQYATHSTQYISIDKDLVRSQFLDIDRDNLSVSTTEVANVQYFDNDGFKPNTDYYGNIDLSVCVSDGNALLNQQGVMYLNPVEDKIDLVHFTQIKGSDGKGQMIFTLNTYGDSELTRADVYDGYHQYGGRRDASLTFSSLIQTGENIYELTMNYTGSRSTYNYNYGNTLRFDLNAGSFKDIYQINIGTSSKTYYSNEVTHQLNSIFHNGERVDQSLYSTHEITIKQSTPIILDLNENGFDLGSQVDFDFDADGQQETGNWLNDSGDAILAYDWNHDGLVNDASEIAFSEYDPNAKTDLEGLALAFDSNHDGVFDAQDEKWKDFGLWKDANLNGQTEEGEFVSMEQAGISSIQLTSDHQQEDGNGYTIFGKGAFTYQDGSEGSFADVALSYEKPAASVSGEPQQATDSVNQDQLDAQLNQLVSAMASNALSANEDVPLPVEETQNHDELLDTAHA